MAFPADGTVVTTSTNTTTAGGTPPAVVVYVSLLCLAAVGVLALVVQPADLASLGDPGVLLLSVLGAVSIVMPLRLHHDGASQGFNLTAAASLTLAVVADSATALLLAGGMSLLGYGVVTRSVLKVAFNAAQTVLSVGLGLGAVALVVDGGLSGDVMQAPTGPALWGAGLLAGLASMLLVVQLLHLHGGGDRAALLSASGRFAMGAAAGDVLVAMLLTILAERSPLAILLAVPTFVGIQLAYRGFSAEREAGRQAQALHDTSRRLLDGAVDDAALAKAVVGLRDLFGAERAALVGPSDDPSHELAAVVDAVRLSGRAQSGTGVADALAAPVVFDGHMAGVVAVSGRRGLDDWGPRDLDLLSTVGGEIAATLRTRQLLEEVRQERALLAAETNKLSDVLASASDGIVVLDADGRVEACNPAMTELLGLDTAPLDARWHEVLQLEDDAGRRLVTVPDHPLTRAFAARTTVTHTDAALRRPDGSVRWLRCSVAPVVSDDERRGVVLVAIDRTREREVEQLRGDFIATVSHELRTPLTPLRGFLGVLREHGDALDEQRRTMMVEAMEKQVLRLSDLIADLLQVAEVDAGAVDVTPRLLNVTATVREVLDELDETDRSRVRTALEPTTAVADPAALQRIVRALLSNACKHTDGRATLSTMRRDGQVVVAVDDEGPGIAPNDRQTVFQPFRRLGDHLHRTQGPGVGLAVARALAEAQDATLEIVDRDGAGTRFELVLPGAVQALDPLPLDEADWAG